MLCNTNTTHMIILSDHICWLDTCLLSLSLSLVCVSGERCEISSRSGRCADGVCKNGGTCLNLLVGGFKCECPPGGLEKPFCSMSSRNFPPNSFITFRGLRQRFHFTITLSWVHTHTNAHCLMFFSTVTLMCLFCLSVVVLCVCSLTSCFHVSDVVSVRGGVEASFSGRLTLVCWWMLCQ